MPPYQVQQILTAVNLIWVQRQKLQQIKLPCRHIDFPAQDKQTPALAIQLQVAILHNFGIFFLRLVRRGPAHNCLYPCFYLQNVKGLGYVIIRAIFQAKDFIHIIPFCSKHHNGDRRKFPYVLTYFKPVHFGKHQVKQYHIVFIFRSKP